MTPKPQPGDACALQNALNFRFQSCYQTLGEYFSTRQPFWTKKARRCGDWGDSSLVNRLSLRGLSLQLFNVQLHNEIIHAFSPKLPKPEFTASDSHFFGSNAGTWARASAERATGNVQKYAAGASSEDRNFTAHDFPVRCVYQLSGQCRCKWQQHSWRRRERTRDCSRSNRR